VRALLPGPPPNHAQGEERTRPSVEIVDRFVFKNRILEELRCLIDVAAGSCDQAMTAQDVRETLCRPSRRASASHRSSAFRGLVDPAELEHALGVVVVVHGRFSGSNQPSSNARDAPGRAIRRGRASPLQRAASPMTAR
jgi:hypothetical protein